MARLKQMLLPSLHNKGFSLLEVIIAIGLLGLLCMISISLLTNQIALRSSTDVFSNRLHELHMAMTWITQDIEKARLAPVTTSTTPSTSSSFLSPLFLFKNGDFIFFTENFLSLKSDTPESNLTNILYRLNAESDPNWKATNGAFQLMRAADPTITVDFTNTTNDSLTHPFIHGVKSFQLKFWDGSKNRTEWDSTANDTKNHLPKLVFIHMVLYLKPNDTTQLLSLQSSMYLKNTAGLPEISPQTGSESYKWQ